MKLRTQYTITTILMHFVAIAYLYIIDLRIVQVGEMKWDSDLGHVLLVPFVILIAYAWFMLLIAICMIEPEPQVLGNDGDWSAKAVYWLSKFSNLTSKHSL